ncbi:MAG: hypothetical protein AAF292_04190 [Pseudomonadota bacterium]
MERFFRKAEAGWLVRWISAFGAASALATSAYAQAPADNGFTAAGTSVENTFTLDYDVNGVDQTDITNSGSPTTFTVDRLVNHVVQELNSPQAGVPGGSATLTFRVTNTGNDNQAYSFDIFDEGGSATDEFDLTYSLTYVPVDNSDAPTGASAPVDGDTLETQPNASGTELTADIAPDDSIIVSITATIPGGATDPNFDSLRLIAQAREPSAFIVTGGATGDTASQGDRVEGTTDPNSIDGVAQNVLADGTGPGSPPTTVDQDNDALHSDVGQIDVDIPSPNLVVQKVVDVLATEFTGTDCETFATTPSGPTGSVTGIPDGSGGTFTETVAVPSATIAAGNQYTTPGACIEYVIRVLNRTPGTTGNATTTATGIDILDELPSGVRFISARAEGFDNASQPTQDTTGGLVPPNCDPAASPTPIIENCAVRFNGGEMENDNNLAAVRIRAQVY